MDGSPPSDRCIESKDDDFALKVMAVGFFPYPFSDDSGSAVTSSPSELGANPNRLEQRCNITKPEKAAERTNLYLFFRWMLAKCGIWTSNRSNPADRQVGCVE
jgi:hypothetical protein